MIGEIFRFEWRFRRRQAMFWVFCLLFFLLTFAAVTSDAIIIGGGIGKVHRNSPFVIINMLGIMSAIGVLVTTALVATAITRDFDQKTHALFFTRPLRKADFVLGRFGGSFLAAFLVIAASGLGILVGSFMPWQDPELIGPTRLDVYAYALAIFVLPNVFLTGALFFTLASLTRSVLYTYVGVLLFFVGFAVTQAFIADLDNDFLAAMLDPFAIGAFQLETRYWTVIERNTQLLSFDGVFLYNRLLWTAVGLAALVVAVTRFRLAEPEHGRSWLSRLRRKKSAPTAPRERSQHVVIPHAGQHFGLAANLARLWFQTRVEIRGIVRSTPFVAITLFGVLNVVGNAFGTIDQLYGTPVHPVTHLMVRVINGGFSLFLLAIITFYAGELVWKERQVGLSEVYDAMPIPNWVPLLSKLAALLTATAILLGVAMGTTIVIQAARGYFNFELPLYFEAMYLVAFPGWAIVCALALFVQVFVNHKYLGFGVMVVFFISQQALPALDLEHNLYRFGNTPGAPYSDMNGYGHFVAPTLWFTLYWAIACVLLLLIANLFWVRGPEGRLRIRAKIARRRVGPANTASLIAASVAFFATGGFIFYNTNILNDYAPSEAQETLQVEYEKRYKQYEGLDQPRITAARLDVDIYPERRSADIAGVLTMVNKHDHPIEELHVLFRKELRIEVLDVPGGTIEHDDREIGYRIYALDPPMAPGATMELAFDFAVRTQGFENNGSNTNFVGNGTFFNNVRYVPQIGYSKGFELSDPNERRKRGLPERERMAKVDDPEARKNTYISHEADWIDFEATVSTSPDQIAIAPGYLQREWTEDGRRHFHYKMDAPILNFYAFLSADYTVVRDQWNDVAIEIYHHRPHGFNVDKMIDATKKSLDYFTAAFSPYQHKQVRIMEFPRYASFAQSFPNTIPFSESIGFIANLKDPDDIDYVFYVTAHEVAHQWWAHQVIGGDVQGSTLLSETMAQYSALMVMEKQYGRDKMRRFLEFELNNYLRSRGGERIKEMPLLYVENQPYIHYRKGSLVMYALREYIGEQELNAAIADYVKEVAFQGPPYTNSLEFIAHIKSATPDHLQYLIEDMFETITLYDNRTVAATVTPTDDGRYTVKLDLQLRKLRADELGTETEVEFDDWFEVGVFGEKAVDGDTEETTLYLEKHQLSDAETTLEITVDELPVKAGIDPRILLIDRNPKDNTQKLEAPASG